MRHEGVLEMSAYGYKQTFWTYPADVRFTPESGHSGPTPEMSAYDPKRTFTELRDSVGGRTEKKWFLYRFYQALFIIRPPLILLRQQFDIFSVNALTFRLTVPRLRKRECGAAPLTPEGANSAAVLATVGGEPALDKATGTFMRSGKERANGNDPRARKPAVTVVHPSAEACRRCGFP